MGQWPQREKMYLLTCAPKESNQPNHSLRLTHEETLHPWLSKMSPMNILLRFIILRMHRLIWIFVRRTCVKVCFQTFITKTRPYNFDPLKPHFYLVKLGFTGVYIIFLILLKHIDYGYSLEPPRRGGSNEYPQSMFWTEIWKIFNIFE